MDAPTQRAIRALLLGGLLALGQGGLAIAASPTVAPAPTDLRSPTGSEALSVVPSLISAGVKAGGTSTAELTLRAGVPLDITIAPQGLAQLPDGNFESVKADKDASPYSARAMIDVAPTSFKLKAGETKKVTVTIKVPADAGEGTRYAILDVTGMPASATENVGFGVELGVSTLVTVADTPQTRVGIISDLSIGKSLPGQPLPVTASLKNTGNTHYGAPPYGLIATATLQDSNGNLVAKAQTSSARLSLVPTFVRALELALDPANPLTPGRYHLEVGAGLEDGTILDQKALDFEWSGGAILGETAVPALITAPPATPTTSDSAAGPPLYAIAALAALVGAVIVALLVLMTLRRRRPPAAGTPAT